MNPPTLSYILATRNKLPYLKITLGKIIAHKKADEEILVADGASTDGSRDYLERLLKEGKIDYLVSEKDTGLAHALNKLCLAARGTLIKYVTDDDAFSFDSIAACKEFMLAHPEIDIVSGESASFHRVFSPLDTDPLELIRAIPYEKEFQQWLADHTPFSFCDLGVLIRRSSLPVVGFWDPIYPGPDIEFSLRVTAGRSTIAWYTGYTSVNISNPQSVSLVHMKKIKDQKERLAEFYLGKKADSYLFSKLRALRTKLRTRSVQTIQESPSKAQYDTLWPRLTEVAERWLEIKNHQIKPEFLHK